MSVLLNKDKTELMINCNCGCDNTIHIKIDKEDLKEANDKSAYYFLTYMKGNFYVEQHSAFRVLKEKLKKIWTIIRNKDYCYSEIIMTKEDFEEFKEFINRQE